MSTTTRSGEAKAEALASTCRERSNTNLAVFPSCESRAPTATGGPASPANPRGSGPAISVKTARAASRPIRAIPLPLSAASSPIVPMPRQRNHSRFDWVERRSTGREGPRKQKRAGETLYDGLTGSKSGFGSDERSGARVDPKSQTGKELANANGGAYLWNVTNSD